MILVVRMLVVFLLSGTRLLDDRYYGSSRYLLSVDFSVDVIASVNFICVIPHRPMSSGGSTLEKIASWELEPITFLKD